MRPRPWQKKIIKPWPPAVGLLTQIYHHKCVTILLGGYQLQVSTTLRRVHKVGFPKGVIWLHRVHPWPIFCRQPRTAYGCSLVKPLLSQAFHKSLFAIGFYFSLIFHFWKIIDCNFFQIQNFYYCEQSFYVFHIIIKPDYYLHFKQTKKGKFMKDKCKSRYLLHIQPQEQHTT